MKNFFLSFFLKQKFKKLYKQIFHFLQNYQPFFPLKIIKKKLKNIKIYKNGEKDHFLYKK